MADPDLLPAEVARRGEDGLGEWEAAHLRIQDLGLLSVLRTDDPQPLAVRL